MRTELRDLPIPHSREVRDRTGLAGLERFDTTLVITGWIRRRCMRTTWRACTCSRARTALRRVVGTEELPDAYRDLPRDIDEIWAPTSFIARALTALGRPVRTMLPGVRLPAFAPRGKAHFGLSPEKFTFLFVFDMNSRMPRKNPLGLIRAFRLAFRPEEAVELAIKVTPQEQSYREMVWAELRLASARCRRDADRPQPCRAGGVARGSWNAANAYVSLHRSEGFGLTMAEAMPWASRRSRRDTRGTSIS